eukprot:gnl/TRDRNA2_/TRDRNA2_144338_c3_seq1.p1 gnl/TRDRNA2_/TRDRNA2_144338_c3~~gnl/TRDRNA2_/TRDRNA2_144338_c3_seq1.p1  ORF type:complete len:228 (-),score=45.18 gnl/TRDRNA2_/TRDRNA2_144338_c3_seq1:136-819(-)
MSTSMAEATNPASADFVAAQGSALAKPFALQPSCFASPAASSVYPTDESTAAFSVSGLSSSDDDEAWSEPYSDLSSDSDDEAALSGRSHRLRRRPWPSTFATAPRRRRCMRSTGSSRSTGESSRARWGVVGSRLASIFTPDETEEPLQVPKAAEHLAVSQAKVSEVAAEVSQADVPEEAMSAVDVNDEVARSAWAKTASRIAGVFARVAEEEDQVCSDGCGSPARAA